MRILELFSGIGGLHWALKQSEIDFEIVGAMEFNPVVLDIYALNFPTVNIMQRNIESLSAAEVNEMGVDAILMSPPCQPFCRTGLKQGSKDNRSSPLNHILDILPDIQFKYIFVENVHGFESSDARDGLLETLQKCRFKWQEFSLNPISLGVPNSRLRYYLIGKEESLPWPFEIQQDVFLKDLPCLKESPDSDIKLSKLIEKQNSHWKERRRRAFKVRDELSDQDNHQNSNINTDSPWTIGDILQPPSEVPSTFILREDKASKYLQALDIVTPSSSHSCCFTKAYYHYLTGTGSILDTNIEIQSDESRQKERTLRYFTPREVSRLLCYPEEFKFPENHSPKQCYRALGNSVNVYVISLLLALLFEN